MHEKCEIDEGLISDVEIEGNIEFKNLSFSYDKGNKVLKNISFSVKKGETVALVGPSGCGKSTLAMLLPRLFNYTEGSILIDGRELKTFDKNFIRKNIALILQEPFLYSKSVRENIAIAVDDTVDSRVYQAAEMASLHHVIEKFQDGYDTAVGEKGVTLSGGQKQRVAIARTVIQDTPIIIFDDSLSAVDTETDSRIRKAIKERKKESTTFIISHRITTLSEADTIIVLDKGKISQKGKHEQLILEPGLYKRIWNIQSELEEELNEELTA